MKVGFVFSTMVLLQKNEISFPDPELYYPEDGLIAVGGDLSIERLWLAYQLGIFPWYNPDEEILWWCPDPRFVLFPEELKISKSMKKIMERDNFQFTENQNFLEVIEQCGNIKRNHQEGTWITDELKTSFVKLAELGLAKSVEVWQNEKLVGGLYGIQIGDVFCGESMFSKVSNASKAGFIYFIQKNKSSLKLIDCQVHTEHLESLGARMISKNEFLHFLKNNP